LAGMPCNRTGMMATTPGFTVFNICGDCLRRHRNESFCENSNDSHQFTVILSEA